MKKIITIFIICILLTVLDNSLAPFLAIKGYYPSFLFVFVICYSIINDKWEGLWIGVFAGILQDIFFINGFGVNSLINMFMCVLAGEIGTNIFKEKSLVPIVANLLLSLFKGILVFVILYLIGINTNLTTIAFDGVYNMAVSILFYRIIYNLCQREFMQKRWKFK